MPLEKKTLSRRRFLLGFSGIFVIISGLSAPMFLEWKRKALKTWRSKGNTISVISPVDETTIKTVSLFIESYFGQNLTAEDHTELIERMKYSAKYNSTYLAEYKMLHHYLDEMAKNNNVSIFADASVETKEKIIGNFLEKSIHSRLSKIRALFSQTERNHRMLRASTMPHLNKLYRHSGVPWRHRGYSSWPGVPGDPTEYTRPGTARTC